MGLSQPPDEEASLQTHLVSAAADEALQLLQLPLQAGRGAVSGVRVHSQGVGVQAGVVLQPTPPWDPPWDPPGDPPWLRFDPGRRQCLRSASTQTHLRLRQPITNLVTAESANRKRL